MIQKLMNDSTVKLLQEYIRIDTSREENVGEFCIFFHCIKQKQNLRLVKVHK